MTVSEPSAPRTVIRLRVLGVVVAALFSLMFIRLWYLQVLDTSAYSKTVTANQVRPVEVPAPRGLITDRNNNIIVGDQVTQDITLSRVAAQEHPAVVGQLAALLGMSSAQIEADLANVQYSLYKPVPILENAPLSDVLYIGEHASMFPGVSTVADTNRTYPLGQTGVQMLGYVGQISSEQLQANKSAGYQLGDLFGQSGLENQYQAALRGRPGVDRVEVDAHGQVVGSLGETPPTSGDDLVTNIDSGLEQTLQQALDAEIASLKGKSTEGRGRRSRPTDRGGARPRVVTDVRPDVVDERDLHRPLPPDPGHGRPEQQRHPGPLHAGIDVQVGHGHSRAADRPDLARASPTTTPGAYTVPGCETGGAGCVTYHDNEGEVGGRINVSQALTVSSDIFFYNLGVQFWNDYKANRAVRRDPHPGRRGTTRLRRRHRDRPAQRDPPLPGGLAHGRPARACPGPQGLSEQRLVHREQPRARLRPGRHRDHPARTGRRLRHLRQRGDPIRPRGRCGHGRRPRQGRAHHRSQGRPGT